MIAGDSCQSAKLALPQEMDAADDCVGFDDELMESLR
jgi:hypothetical protein